MNSCGATGIIAEAHGDDDGDEAIITQPVYMSGHFEVFFSIVAFMNDF